MNEFEIMILALRQIKAESQKKGVQSVVTFDTLLRVMERANIIQEDLARKEREKQAIDALLSIESKQ